MAMEFVSHSATFTGITPFLIGGQPLHGDRLELSVLPMSDVQTSVHDPMLLHRRC